jgi:dTDP-4-amino-4,6-dideoxygalactose transaminase
LIKKYRPAGNSIALKKAPVEANLFYPYRYRLFQSGTASLAAAIAACIKLKYVRDGQAEIILPAYACPDLVSAVLYAGAKPVLVDLEENSPSPSCMYVLNSITADTVAIIAVNFMGLSGNIPQLRNACENNDLFLIYDCAQWFPLDEGYVWPGDFNIISFGRGKPVNLLHGGAVIVDDPAIEKALVVLPVPKPNAFYNLTQHLKIKLYNLVTQPRTYRFVSQLPGLNIGHTLYKPLETITAMSPYYTGLLKHNIDKFRSQTKTLQYLHKRITNITHPLLIKLVVGEQYNDPGYLLRYPILIKNKKTRDRFFEQTQDYGTSILYQRPLSQISGLENILDQDTVYPNASQFADHLVTLPCHEDIDNIVVDLIIDKLHSALKDNLE